MIKNYELNEKNCLLYKNLDFLGKKWTIFILLQFFTNSENKIRYSQIKDTLPKITAKILSSRLDELVKMKILKKYLNKEIFPNIAEYKITQTGKDLKPIIKSLRKWEEKHYSCNFKTNCKKCVLKN